MMSAPLARTSSGRIALTVAAVPTGMNAGVRISPRFMAMTPVLAAPSIAEMAKEKRVTGALLASATLPGYSRGNARALGLCRADHRRRHCRLRRFDRGRRRTDRHSRVAV